MCQVRQNGAVYVGDGTVETHIYRLRASDPQSDCTSKVAATTNQVEKLRSSPGDPEEKIARRTRAIVRSQVAEA